MSQGLVVTVIAALIVVVAFLKLIISNYKLSKDIQSWLDTTNKELLKELDAVVKKRKQMEQEYEKAKHDDSVPNSDIEH